MFEHLLDEVDSTQNTATVVSLLNLMREAISGSGEYTIAEVLEMYDEYFTKNGYIKTPFGRMKKERWQTMIDKKIVIRKYGHWKVTSETRTVKNSHGKDVERCIATDWL